MIPQFLKSLFLLLLLSACATQKHVQSNWPAELPPLAYFEAVYAADAQNAQEQTLDEYLLWVKRYYLGWELYRRGWMDVTEDLVGQMDDPQKAEHVKEKMFLIGKSVSGEWAKKTKQRKIFTRHVAIWGNALVESMMRGEEEVLINSVASDVNNLLAEKLPVEAITADRYYQQDKNDIFR